jgi:hypothetical protein
MGVDFKFVQDGHADAEQSSQGDAKGMPHRAYKEIAITRAQIKRFACLHAAFSAAPCLFLSVEVCHRASLLPISCPSMAQSAEVKPPPTTVEIERVFRSISITL